MPAPTDPYYSPSHWAALQQSGGGGAAPVLDSAGNLGASHVVALGSSREGWLFGTLNAATCAITVTGAQAGDVIRLFLTQDATGGRAATFQGQALVLDTTALAVTEVDAFTPDGTSWIMAGTAAAAAPRGPRMKGVIHPPGLPPSAASTAASGGVANRTYLCRVEAGDPGFIRDLAVYVGSQPASSFVEVSIWTPASTRAKLWSSGAVATPASGAWRIIGDPGTNVACAVGDIFDFGITVSDSTQSLGRPANPLVGDMPASFWPSSGASPKAFGRADIGAPGSLATTIAEASVATSSISAYLVCGRIA